MLCSIIRPFDLVSIFWTYKIRINEQEFLFRGRGTKCVDIMQAATYNIVVSTTNLYSPSASKQSCELNNESQIIIMSKFTNWAYIFALLVGIASALIGWLVFNSVLIIWLSTFAYIMLHTYFFSIRRKRSFKITISTLIH